MIWTQNNLSSTCGAQRSENDEIRLFFSRSIRVLFSVFVENRARERNRLVDDPWREEKRKRGNEIRQSSLMLGLAAQVINERNDFITFSLIFHRFNSMWMRLAGRRGMWMGWRLENIKWCFDWCFSSAVHASCELPPTEWMGMEMQRVEIRVNCRLSIARGYFLSIYVISSDFRHSFSNGNPLWQSSDECWTLFQVSCRLLRWDEAHVYQFQILIEHFPRLEIKTHWNIHANPSSNHCMYRLSHATITFKTKCRWIPTSMYDIYLPPPKSPSSNRQVHISILGISMLFLGIKNSLEIHWWHKCCCGHASVANRSDFSNVLARKLKFTFTFLSTRHKTKWQWRRVSAHWGLRCSAMPWQSQQHYR